MRYIIGYTQELLEERMTEFFHYDDMTWDAVAALPRDTPLVLPLGWGYDFNTLASQLK